MHRVVIFGNSGSGKSTLASEKAEHLSCSHLDLDTVAWEDGRSAPTRKSLVDSEKLRSFFLTQVLKSAPQIAGIVLGKRINTAPRRSRTQILRCC